MRVVAHDPFVAPERARQINVELLDLDELVAVADFLTLHVVKTPETLGMISADLLAKAKPNLRIVNVSRGGVIDEAALADAIRDGRIGGAAIDVFATEPTTESPLFDAAAGRRHAAPRRQHGRGAGQGRRHDRRAGRPGARRRVRALRRERRRRRGVEHRAPLPAAGRAPRPALRRASSTACPTRWRSPTRARSAEADTRILTLSVLKGMFGSVSDEPVSYVNAPRLAAERGVEVRESSSPVVARLRQPRHRARRRPRHRRHARRPPGRAPPRAGRRPLGRRPPGRPHARGPQRGRARA